MVEMKGLHMFCACFPCARPENRVKRHDWNCSVSFPWEHRVFHSINHQWPTLHLGGGRAPFHFGLGMSHIWLIYMNSLPFCITPVSELLIDRAQSCQFCTILRVCWVRIKIVQSSNSQLAWMHCALITCWDYIWAWLHKWLPAAEQG